MTVSEFFYTCIWSVFARDENWAGEQRARPMLLSDSNSWSAEIITSNKTFTSQKCLWYIWCSRNSDVMSISQKNIHMFCFREYQVVRVRVSIGNRCDTGQTPWRSLCSRIRSWHLSWQGVNSSSKVWSWHPLCRQCVSTVRAGALARFLKQG